MVALRLSFNPEIWHSKMRGRGAKPLISMVIPCPCEAKTNALLRIGVFPGSLISSMLESSTLGAVGDTPAFGN